MIIFFQELILQLFLWLLKLIDGIMSIFSSIAGIVKIDYRGEEVNLLEFIIGDSTVGTIFWCVFLLGMGLCCIFAISAVIKNMVSNNREVSTIVGKFFLSILGTLALLAVVVLGILISDSLLKLVAEIFEIGNTTKLSNALFNACVGDWINGYSIAEMDISSLSVSDIFGEYNTTFKVFPTSWKCNGMVNPNTFLFLPAMIASVGLGIALLIAIVNLAKRIYEIVILYFVMPVSVSTLSLDDGARFKIWRETFISKIVVAYGTVFSVNVFILILPIISAMKIDGIGSFGNAIYLIVMILGGATVIPAGQTLFARLFGGADDMRVNGGFVRSVWHGTHRAGMMAWGAGALMLHGAVNAGKKIVAHRKHSDNTNNKDGTTGTNGENDSNKYTDEKTVEHKTDEGDKQA